MNLWRKIKTASKVGQKHGWNGLKNRLDFQFLSLKLKFAYQKWIRKFDTLTETDLKDICREIANFSHKPLISIVLPVYNVEEKFLRLCLESVRRQIYENWQLCIADDFSPKPHIRRVLEEYAEKDKRIKVVFRPENGHISAASNSALALAGGEFTVLLDHDDELSQHALFYVVREINDFPETAMIYSDEDLISAKGKRFNPKFKPDFSRDLFYSLNLITHLSAYKTEILQKIGGFRIGLEGSQDYDLALRVIEQIPENRIRHIPKILYHWRVIEGSVALSGDEKPYAHSAARTALSDHFKRTGKNAAVEPTFLNLHRVRYELPPDLPKVSLILAANEDAEFTRRSIEKFTNETDYANVEIVLVRSEKSGRELFSKEIKTIFTEIPSEAEKYNLAVAQSNSEILCFVDVNLQPLSKDWLKEMVSFALQKESGAVGAKLFYPNRSILHGGFIVGINDSAGIAHQRLPDEKYGNMMRAKLTGNFAAVSISCLAVKRAHFEQANGFDARNFPNKFFDVDFCLKLLQKNFRNIFTPYAELIQIDGRKMLNVQKKPDEKELENFQRKWQKYIEKDPFYNPNLSKKSGNFLIDI